MMSERKTRIFATIKVISITLMCGAIGLELWHLLALMTDWTIHSFLNPVFWIERSAIAIHLVEAMIAAFYAPTKQKPSIQYGTYTFFVGTVGLLELFD